MSNLALPDPEKLKTLRELTTDLLGGPENRWVKEMFRGDEHEALRAALERNQGNKG